MQIIIFEKNLKFIIFLFIKGVKMYFKEYIGYLASILVAISLMMSSVLKLRILNLIGSLIFSIYGFIINSYPVGFLNLFIVIVNIFYLIKMIKISEYFTLIEVLSNSPYLQKFLEFYNKDIIHFFPFFNFYKEKKVIDNENLHFYFILRDLIPTGLLIIENKKDFSYVHIDYVIPAYRDFKIAKFLFVENKNFFIINNIKKLRTHTSNNLHISYLTKIGFKRIDKDELGEIFEKDFEL